VWVRYFQRHADASILPELCTALSVGSRGGFDDSTELVADSGRIEAGAQTVEACVGPGRRAVERLEQGGDQLIGRPGVRCLGSGHAADRLHDGRLLVDHDAEPGGQRFDDGDREVLLQ
jgi:hypothetical protein